MSPSVPRPADVVGAVAVSGPAARPGSAPVDDPLRGILLLVAAMLLFSLSDATAKFLSQALPAIEIAWLRYLVFVLLMLPAARQGRSRLVSRRPGLQAWRALSLLGSSIFFILAIGRLPLADATATSFVSPLFITALSIPLLGEKVGIRRWGAVVVGLIGVLIVVRPGTSAFNPASVLPLLSAASWAIAMVITRKTSGLDGTLTMLAYTAFIGFAVLCAALPFVWVGLGPRQIALGCFIGIASTAGQWLVVLAYRRANASLLAPFAYTQLIWSSLLGLAVFAAIPDGQTLVGAAIIVVSGIYTAHRERVVARRQALSPLRD